MVEKGNYYDGAVSLRDVRQLRVETARVSFVHAPEPGPSYVLIETNDLVVSVEVAKVEWASVNPGRKFAPEYAIRCEACS